MYKGRSTLVFSDYKILQKFSKKWPFFHSRKREKTDYTKRSKNAPQAPQGEQKRQIIPKGVNSAFKSLRECKKWVIILNEVKTPRKSTSLSEWSATSWKADFYNYTKSSNFAVFILRRVWKAGSCGEIIPKAENSALRALRECKIWVIILNAVTGSRISNGANAIREIGPRLYQKQ